MEQNEIEMRVARARELHEKGSNCCQSVVLAFADKLPVSPDAASKMAAAFGRGISGLRETCGCVSGMALVCGLTDNTMMTRGLGTQFKTLQGSLNCAQLLQHQGPGHSCGDLVACAARLLAEML